MNDALKLTGHINIKHFRAGELIDERDLYNLIPTVGKALLADLLCGDTGASFVSYLALGLDTTAADASDTVLGSEIVDSGLERALATTSRITTSTTNDTASLAYTWTATGAKAVTELGAFNDATAGTMLGRRVFSAVNVVNTDQLQVTYTFQIS
jgi:hypothetical protein